MALELVQQRDPFCLDGILGAEGGGAQAACSRDAALYGLVELMRTVLALRELSDPSRAGAVEDKDDIVTALLELFHGLERVDGPGQIAMALGVGE